MTKAYDERIDKLLQSAERHSRCLARPRDNALRRALIYRSKHANEAPIYSPHDGLYIRKDYWDSLCRSDQVLHMVKALSHIHPQWIFDSYTAAVIRGWNVPYALPGRHSHRYAVPLSNTNGFRTGISGHYMRHRRRLTGDHNRPNASRMPANSGLSRCASHSRLRPPSAAHPNRSPDSRASS